ncbi:transposase family protein [Niallia sp. 03133]|uniref:transposase family protein n=1 Tax=Niallia sp. 03133 TaxID=3458060 RepID=UPI004044C4A3
MISWSAPDPHLELVHVANVGDLLILTVKSIHTSACCPSCQRISTRSHSRYSRKVQDLPISDQAVLLSIVQLTNISWNELKNAWFLLRK